VIAHLIESDIALAS